jgi:hypothetical protein
MTAACDLLAELQGLGIEVQAHGEALRFHPRDKVTPDLLARLKDSKADLLRLLAQPSDSLVKRRGGLLVDTAADLDDSETIDPPPPCPRCGGLMFWWGLLGGRHCMTCDARALARSRRWAGRVEKLKQRYVTKQSQDRSTRPMVASHQKLRCNTCQFYDPFGNPDRGQCRGSLPVIGFSATDGVWPTVSASDWCGHHRPLAATPDEGVMAGRTLEKPA